MPEVFQHLSHLLDACLGTGGKREFIQVLLTPHLKQLKLPTVLGEYDKEAREYARNGIDHSRYLPRLIELKLLDRERRTVERRIHPARFPATNSIPGLNKVLELARCDDILRRKNIIALGNSGTGLLHLRPAGLESDDRW